MKKFWFWLKGEVAELTSEVLESDLFGKADTILTEAEALIARAQQERNALQTEIDALTRQVAEKDALIEAARVRAEKAAKLAHTIKRELDGR